jgi:hypothetical protein
MNQRQRQKDPPGGFLLDLFVAVQNEAVPKNDSGTNFGL